MFLGPGFPTIREYQSIPNEQLISMPVAGTIELVPEPSTLTLIGMGLVGLRRKSVLQKLSVRPLLFRAPVR